MFAASVLTIRALIVSRHRIEAMENREMKNRRAKDIKFAINSIVLDVLFVLFQTPICLSYFIDIPDMTTYYTFYLTAAVFFFLNYTIPFFTYIISNSLFRREIIKMMGLGHYAKHSTTATRIDTRIPKN